MHLARVIGTVWATRHAPGFSGRPLLLLQPQGPDGRDSGAPLVAADPLGTGPGEHVFYVTAREAVVALTGESDALVPADAAIVGIVESLEHTPVEQAGAGPDSRGRSR
ncbi:MAG: EutN/CcmL family microcompartment protein [Planctomycetes bacterium]|nr:EutN/CcmL family microcompartment protein [Planctomycetota bacterium]